MRILGWAALAVTLATAGHAQARITHLEIVRTEPAFGGQTFGAVGAYEHVVAIAHGEIDPAAPVNAVIQDIALAPRNAAGHVEYSTQVELLKPADIARGNGVVLMEVVNRGNKLALANFNAGGADSIADLNALKSPRDGWLMRQGTTLAWWGWEMDGTPGLDRVLMPPVVAHNADGSPVTGVVRAELLTPNPVRRSASRRAARSNPTRPAAMSAIPPPASTTRARRSRCASTSRTAASRSRTTAGVLAPAPTAARRSRTRCISAWPRASNPAISTS